MSSLSSLPPKPDLQQLRNQAKDLLKGHQAADPEAAHRLRLALPELAGWSDAEIFRAKLALKGAQRAIAREYGFAEWIDLKRRVEALRQPPKTTLQTLIDAVEEADVETVKALLQRAPKDSPVLSLLGLAASRSDKGNAVSAERLAIVQAFIDAGADLEQRANSHMFPLGTAAWLGLLPYVELLIAAGADIDAEPEPTDTALSVADHRHVEVVERLIQAGAAYDARPLAQAGLVERLAEFLDSDPEAVNRIVHLGHLNGVYGPPLLALVEDYGFEDPHLPAVAQLLIDRGANINLRDSADRTALQQVLAKRQSCERGGVDTRYCDAVIQLLLDHGARVDLFAAIGLDDLQRVQSLLKEQPQAIDQKDSGNRTALQQVLAKRQWCEQNDRDIGYCDAVIQLLLDHGAKVDLPTAIDLGDLQRVQTILEEQPQALNLRDSANWTALQQVLAKRQACEQNGQDTGYCDAVIQQLKDHGGEVDLLAAIDLGDVQQVQTILVEKPEQIDLRDSDGWSPLDLAVEHELTQIEALLRAAGTQFSQNVEAMLEEAAPDHSVHKVLAQSSAESSPGYMHLDHTAGLDIREQISLAAWVYMLGEGGTVVGKWFQRGTWSYVLHGPCGDNGFHLRWEDDSQTDSTDFTAPFLQWVHYAATYDGRHMQVYINGELVAQQEVSGKRIKSTDNPVWVGDSGYLGGTPGLIDDVQIWNVARTQAQIRQSMHEGLAGDEAGLVGWWPLDNPALHDRSPYGNHGRLEGAATVHARDIPKDGHHAPAQVLWLLPLRP